MKTTFFTICLLLFSAQVFTAGDLTEKKLYCPYEDKSEILNNHIRTFVFISDNQVTQSFYDVKGKIKSTESNYSVEFNSIEIDGVLEPIQKPFDGLLYEELGSGSVINGFSISRDKLFLVSHKAKYSQCKLYSHTSNDSLNNKAKQEIDEWAKKLDRKL